MTNRLPSYAPKSARRTRVVDSILACLGSDQIFKTLDYRRKSEAYIKQYMHQPLQSCLLGLYRELGGDLREATLRRKVKAALLWEGDVSTTINNIRFLGVQHRPDFVVRFEELRIAVEIKRGEAGSAIRDGIGQSLIYAASEDYDFVAYLFVDTSRDKKIHDSLRKPADRAFVESLWQNYNIRFQIV